MITMTKGEMLFYKALIAIVALFTSASVGVAGWQLNKTIDLIEQLSIINNEIQQIKNADFAKMKYVESTDNIILKEIVSMTDRYEKLNNRVDYNRQCINELKVRFAEKHPSN